MNNLKLSVSNAIGEESGTMLLSTTISNTFESYISQSKVLIKFEEATTVASLFDKYKFYLGKF